MQKITYKEGLKTYLDFLRNIDIRIDIFTEFKYESLADFCLKGSIDELLFWYNKQVEDCQMKVEKIPLEDCRKWHFSKKEGCISHESGDFFRVEGYRVTGTKNREVTYGWDQPFLTQEGHDGGILGLIRKRFEGIPHYLIEAKQEPGNFNIVQVSTTVQATFSNLRRAHKGNATLYSQYFLNPEKFPVTVILDQWMSEDGGRLFNKRNRVMLLEYDENASFEIQEDRFKWVSLFQLKQLIAHENAIIAPHIRSVIAAL